MIELIKKLRQGAGEDFLDIVLELEELVDVYIVDEFIDSELVLKENDELRRKLDSLAIPKPKQLRLHTILSDINQDRHRVQTILKRLAEAEGDEHLLTLHAKTVSI